MARNDVFLNTTIRIIDKIESDARRKRNEEIRFQNAQIREQNRLQREYEKQLKQEAKQAIAIEKEKNIQYASNKTLFYNEQRLELQSLLKHIQEEPIRFNYDDLKQYEKFSEIEPSEPFYIPLPQEINSEDFNPKFSIFDKIFISQKNKKIKLASELLQNALRERENQVDDINKKNLLCKENYENEHNQWVENKEKFEKSQNDFNSKISEREENFHKNERKEIEFYFKQIIKNIRIPNELLLNFELSYDSKSKILIINYDLPEKEIISNIKTIKYIATRKEFTETFLKDTEVNSIYNEIIYQLSLRISNDIYISDIYNQIDSIVFNGIYFGINKSTGIEEEKCILSLQTSKNDFLKINLKQVDAKSCFQKFKGVSGANLADYISVPPIINFDKNDNRFISSKEVLNKIEGVNLASMDWEDFEHLVREVFEKEFSGNNAEIKITQSSRDGGVDAVVFDPDPIRGGKYIIQAKRYTNVVGVSAVRDLYGTIINEGASKGILVTTSWYGSDSREFAKDKPIILIDGDNLIYMMKKHGYNARIDIDEAKRNLGLK